MLDLHIDYNTSANNIIIVDISTYSNNPKNPTLEIIVPGFNKKAVMFVPKAANIITSEYLGLQDEFNEFPDGLYYLKYSVQPNTTRFVERQYFRTYRLKCLYDRAILSTDLLCPCAESKKTSTRQKLLQINLLLNGAIAAASRVDNANAQALYDKASCLLSELPKCNC